jgi:GNAT superfamily N-acetyltransferase
VHVFETLHVESARTAEVGGLVVEASRRDRGIGAALMDAAEAWARGRRLERVRVRSNVVRTAAHRFYVRQGYSVLKQQAVFSKHLAR